MLMADTAAMIGQPQAFRGPLMIFIGFLGFNMGVGVSYGTFGVIMKSLETEFDTDRGLAATALALASLTLGLLSPVVGFILNRWPVRRMMIVGAMLNALAYLLLTLATTIYQVLAIYALLIGPSLGALSVVAGQTLISRWFITGRGRALGICNMPIMMALAPLIASWMLRNYGLDAVFLTNMVLSLAIVPILMLAVEHPANIGQRARGEGVTGPAGQAAATGMLVFETVGQVLRRAELWMLVVGISIVGGAGTLLVVHLVPFISDKGIPIEQAATAAMVFGIATSIGAPAFGWLADKIGPVNALAAEALLLLVPWLALILAPPSMPLYLVIAASLGICCGGITTLQGAAISALFGVGLFSRLMGLSFLLKLPFNFAAAPFAGYVLDVYGSYVPALVSVGCAILLAGCSFLLMRFFRAPVRHSQSA